MAAAMLADQDHDDAPIVYLKRGDKIEPAPIMWAWKHYLARRKLHIIAGAPGIGKTKCALAIGAAFSAGSLLPDGSKAPAGDVLIWSGEDDVQDTIVPVLMAMGANMKRVYFISEVSDAGEKRAFDITTDLDGLRRMASQIPSLTLVIIDPIVSVVRGDTNKAGDVRRGLVPLQLLADFTGAAVLGVSHFTKGSQGKDPIERVTGSLAFGAVARVVFAAIKRADEGDHVLMRAKSNIGPVGGGFSYQLDVVAVPKHEAIEAAIVRWSGSVEGNARDVLQTAEAVDEAGGSSFNDAKTFLHDLLADGPVETGRIQRETEGAGHAWATVRRAQRALGVKSEKESGPRGKWRWALPHTQ